MFPAESEALQALLVRMRALHDELDSYNAGICLLHLDAAIAALESRVAPGDGWFADWQRPEPSSNAVSH